MPRRTSRRSLNDADDDDDVVKTEQRVSDQEDDDDDDDDDAMLFSSQAPETTQDIFPVRNADRCNFNSLNETARAKAATDITRLILFKGLAGKTIDRTELMKEAGIQDKRISSAVLEEANTRLKNIFDFELRRMPAWMEKIKSFPKKYKNHYYLINAVSEDSTGAFSKALHAVHDESAVEKGFLMVVLALCYCKGEPRNDGSRWIHQNDLYYLLNKTDENIPAEPPHSSSSKTPASRRVSSSQSGGGGGVSLTPDVDALLHKFIERDYLVKEKVVPDEGTQSQDGEASIFYTMGPRAAMEIGRKQVVYFCAEILVRKRS